MSGRRLFLAISAVLAIGMVGADSAAAGGQTRWWDRGGFVKPCSLEGVNPAYHPGIFGNAAVARAYGFVQSRDGTWHVMSNCHPY